MEHEIITAVSVLLNVTFCFFITHQQSGALCTEGKVAPQDQGATEESAAVSQEEQLTKLENEVASIRSKMKDCTQGMLDAQNTLAKVTNFCNLLVNVSTVSRGDTTGHQ